MCPIEPWFGVACVGHIWTPKTPPERILSKVTQTPEILGHQLASQTRSSPFGKISAAVDPPWSGVSRGRFRGFKGVIMLRMVFQGHLEKNSIKKLPE